MFEAARDFLTMLEERFPNRRIRWATNAVVLIGVIAVAFAALGIIGSVGYTGWTFLFPQGSAEGVPPTAPAQVPTVQPNTPPLAEERQEADPCLKDGRFMGNTITNVSVTSSVEGSSGLQDIGGTCNLFKNVRIRTPGEKPAIQLIGTKHEKFDGVDIGLERTARENTPRDQE